MTTPSRSSWNDVVIAPRRRVFEREAHARSLRERDYASRGAIRPAEGVVGEAGDQRGSRGQLDRHEELRLHEQEVEARADDRRDDRVGIRRQVGAVPGSLDEERRRRNRPVREELVERKAPPRPDHLVAETTVVERRQRRLVRVGEVQRLRVDQVRVRKCPVPRRRVDEARVVDRNEMVLAAAPDEVVAKHRIELGLGGTDVAAGLQTLLDARLDESLLRHVHRHYSGEREHQRLSVLRSVTRARHTNQGSPPSCSLCERE